MTEPTAVDPKAVIEQLTQQIARLSYELALAKAAADQMARQLAAKSDSEG